MSLMKTAFIVLALAVVANAQQTRLRWCVNSQRALDICNTAFDQFNAERPPVAYTCFLPTDGNCYLSVVNGTSDVAVLGALDTYRGYQGGLRAIAAEDKGKIGALDYYSVAIVKKETCDRDPNITLAKLRGQDACFTGYQRTAGWTIPVGYMLYNNIMPYITANASVQNDAESAASYFGKVCAARVVSTGPALLSNGTSTRFDGLCDGCRGDCGTNEPYFDYDGSLRCLSQGGGVVSFNKHEAAFDFTANGNSPKENITLRKDDIRLLCPQGGCATVDNYASCAFSAVPARAVVVRNNQTNVDRILGSLDAIVSSPAFDRTVFNETANPSNLIFSFSLQDLRPLNSTLGHLGKIVEAFDGYDALSDTSVTAQGRITTSG